MHPSASTPLSCTSMDPYSADVAGWPRSSPEPSEPADSPVDFCADLPTQCLPMPGVKCPKCLEKGQEVWVLPGKHCYKCGHGC